MHDILMLDIGGESLALLSEDESTSGFNIFLDNNTTSMGYQDLFRHFCPFWMVKSGKKIINIVFAIK